MSVRFFSDNNQRLFEDYLDQMNISYTVERFVVIAPDMDTDDLDYALELGALQTI